MTGGVAFLRQSCSEETCRKHKSAVQGVFVSRRSQAAGARLGAAFRLSFPKKSAPNYRTKTALDRHINSQAIRRLIPAMI